MLVDMYGRTIDYLRISVTDRCNFRCIYCMPLEGVEWKPHEDILRYEEITQIVLVAAELGIRKVRITGGEPLARKRIESLIKAISSIPEIEETTMTTNGSLITREKAAALKAAGLTRVNISLDTLNPDKFKTITRLGSIDDVVQGIKEAVAAGLTPVKVNMVVFEDTTTDEIEQMKSFCAQTGATLQTISRFSLHNRAEREPVHTDRPPRCTECNRLRLTADGYFKSCLFSDKEQKVNFDDIAGSIGAAVSAKPKNGEFCRSRTMSQIGG